MTDHKRRMTGMVIIVNYFSYIVKPRCRQEQTSFFRPVAVERLQLVEEHGCDAYDLIDMLIIRVRQSFKEIVDTLFENIVKAGFFHPRIGCIVFKKVRHEARSR